MKKMPVLLLTFILFFTGVVLCWGGKNVYREPISIEATKLQALNLEKISDDEIVAIYNGEEFVLKTDSALEEIFDKESFMKDVSQGEGFFVRVKSSALEAPSQLVPLSVKGYNNTDYLLFEDTEMIYIQRQTTALWLFLGAVICIVLSVLLLVLVFLRSKKNRGVK